MYDTILFDFFGVIFDDPQKHFITRHSHRKAEVATVARQMDTGELSYADYIKRLAEIGEEPLAHIQKQFLSADLLNTHVVQSIADLKRKWRVGLLSNTCTDEISQIFAAHNLAGLFHTVVVSAETGMAKPDHDIFRLTLHRMGADAQKTVFIDDNETNVLAARQVGLTAIHFRNVRQLHAELNKLGIDTSVSVGQEA